MRRRRVIFYPGKCLKIGQQISYPLLFFLKFLSKFHPLPPPPPPKKKKNITAISISLDFFLAKISEYIHTNHCVKSVKIRSFFRSVFSCIRTEYGDLLFSPNTGKYRPEKTPYLDTFHAVNFTEIY